MRESEWSRPSRSSGWRRGQEIGGYAVGGRPGRESAGGWDFTRDGQAEDYRNNAGYRSS